MVEDQVASGLVQRQTAFIEPAVEMGEIAAISRTRMFGQAFFQPEGVEEAVNQKVIQGGHGRLLGV
ncbi:hypothetical protein D3C84_1145860 [compost metagenome]